MSADRKPIVDANRNGIIENEVSPSKAKLNKLKKPTRIQEEEEDKIA